MAEKLYKVGEPIKLGYQAPNKQSGLSEPNAPIAEIYDETGAKDLENFPDVALIEKGTTGNYEGTFTPDEQGEGDWKVIMHKADGDGQLPKAYSVGAHNVHSVGESVAAVDSAVGTVDTKVTTIDGKVVGVGNGVVAVGEAVEVVDDKVDTLLSEFESGGTVANIYTAVQSLDTPPVAY